EPGGPPRGPGAGGGGGSQRGGRREGGRARPRGAAAVRRCPRRTATRWRGFAPPPSQGRAGPGGAYGTRGWGALRSSPGIAPLTAALSAVRAQRAADKSKPPPCRRGTREIRAASLDHLNDPPPSGVFRRFRRYVLVGDGSRGPSRLTSSTLFHSPFMLAPVDDRRFWIFAVLPAVSVRCSSQPVGHHPCPEGTRLTCILLFTQLSAHPRAFGYAPAP